MSCKHSLASFVSLTHDADVRPVLGARRPKPGALPEAWTPPASTERTEPLA